MGKSLIEAIEALLKTGAKRAPKAAPDAAEAARVARGKEMFPVEAYHGRASDYDAVSMDKVGSASGKSPINGNGFYASTDPSVASGYAEQMGGNVMPLRINPGNSVRANQQYDWTPELRSAAGPSADWVEKWYVKDGKILGEKLAFIIGGSDQGAAKMKAAGFDSYFPDEKTIVSFDPKNIRSRFAQFDPAKRDSSDLLAGIGAGALALPALNEAVDESKFADGGVPHFGDGGILKRGMKAIARATPKPAVKATELPMADEALVKSAIEKFGLTRNPAEAGYIMPKGQMLDLSGKADTGDYQRIGDFHVPNRGMRDYMGGKRYTDHREIQDIPGIDAGGTDAMYDFMTRARSARFMPMDTGVGFEMTVMPDEQQLLRALEGHRRLTARTPDRDLPRFEITDPKKQATVDSLSYEGSEIEPLMKWFRERVGGMASGGLAGYDDGGSVDYEMEAERQRRRALAGRGRMPDLVEQTRIRDMNRAMPSYSMGDAARTMGEIARDLPGMAARGIGQHYRDQAIGLMTDPLATVGRNVRDTTEMALPVSSLYKMADVATGAEGAEAPDYMDVGMDVANVLGFKGGRDLARRAARPALGLAAAGIAMQPDEAEAGPMKDAINAVRRIKAYHGSPHDFDRFDMSKIGTGEGAQAYGHGLYFAENEGVARNYRDMLTNGTDRFVGGQPYNSMEPEHLAASLNKTYAKYGGRDRVLKVLQDDIANLNLDEASRKTYQRTLDLVKSGSPLANFTTVPKTGRMYEVNINADPARFLDWDNPVPMDSPLRDRVAELGMQGSGALNAADRNMAKNAFLASRNENMTGGGLYNSLTRSIEANRDALKTKFGENALFAKPTELARRDLAERGIPGIRYLDQGSRRAGAGTSNYVVFDDKLIDILRKYKRGGKVNKTAPTDTLARIEALLA